MSKKNIIANSDNAIQILTAEYEKQAKKAIDVFGNLSQRYIESDTGNTALMDSSIIDIQMQSGYNDFVNDMINNGYQTAVNNTYDMYRELTGKELLFQEDTLQKLTKMKESIKVEFDLLNADAGNMLRKNILQLQFDAITRNEAVETFREYLDKDLRRYTATWVKTGMSSYYNQSNLSLATDNGIQKFLYYGTIIATSREFCKEHAGKEYTIEELKGLDNGQGLPVIPYLGGYNCQHRLIAVL